MPKLELKDLSPSDLMVPCKKWYKSKTIWVNAVTITLGIGVGLEALLPILAPVISQGALSWSLFVVGVLNVGLRLITTQGIE